MVTTATPAPEAPAPAPVSSVGRIFGALFSPKTTFESIATRPTWVLPLILICLIQITVIMVFSKQVGWRAFMERQNQTNSRVQKQMENMTADQKAQMLDNQTKFAPIIGYIGAVIGPFVGALIVGAIYLAAFNLILGSRIGFTTSVSIVSYAWVPGIIVGILGIVILFLKDPATVDLQNLVASNPGAMLSDDSPKWLVSLLGSLDIFSFWTMILMSFGYSATNPKKISFGTAFGTVLSVWFIYVIIKVGLTAMFS
jgi:hypothetical protein